jgi:hypothetical protein
MRHIAAIIFWGAVAVAVLSAVAPFVIIGLRFS